MADDAQSIRSLNWRELFPFINLFRAFRIAIHPSKLFLGFAMVFLVYAGGRVLDAVWPTSSYAVWHEPRGYEETYWAPKQTGSFADERDKRAEEYAAEYKSRLFNAKLVKDDDDGLKSAKAGDFRGKLQATLVDARNKTRDEAKTHRDEDLKKNREAPMTEKERAEKERAILEKYEKEYRGAQDTMLAAIDELDMLVPQPLFITFFDYEVNQFHNVVDSALAGNFLGGISHGAPAEAPAVDAHPVGPGVVRSVINLVVVGPTWLLRFHFIYFIIFIVWLLLLWAVFGGAIARVSAVHTARDEKISIRQALRFSSSKLLSFVFAPLIPLIIIVIAGAIVAAGGALLYVPYVGTVVIGGLFILALLAGFVMTLVATGTIGGFNLMYPTIAVEGSDSFDAISRSFSYVFARPWRMAFYTVVSLLYGSLCFLFVRFFVYIMLVLTQFFVQWFVWGARAYHWQEIWPPVKVGDLTYRINFQALNWGDGIGALLIAIWVYIVLSFVAAFVISFYFSANTIIYSLMRREVDATELDDVYIEESEDEFTEVTAPSTTPAPATPAPAEGTSTTATPPPA